MKEFSIEEKAQRYNEAVERLRNAFYDNNSRMCEEYRNAVLKIIEPIFPELKESEDERIRKRIIHALHGDVLEMSEIKEAVAWLEKQEIKEHNACDTCDEKASCVNPCPMKLVEKLKPTDKAEPKFNVGDWIIHNDNKHIPIKIIEKIGMYYRTVDTVNYYHNIWIDCINKNYHLWTIQDAKDGDVLAAELMKDYPIPFIAMYKERGLNFFNSHCFVSCNGEFHKGTTGHAISLIHPATREQRELLFQKMHDAGYEWDANKKFLKKIEQKSVEWSTDDLPEFESYLCLMFQKFRAKGVCTNGEIVDFVKEHSQKLKDTLCHVWSEEDEEIVEALNEYVKNLDILFSEIKIGDKDIISKEFREKVQHWLKNFKDRVQPQPKQEWSDEDENLLKEFMKDIRLDMLSSYAEKYCNWLKNLKDRVQPQPKQI